MSYYQSEYERISESIETLKTELKRKIAEASAEYDRYVQARAVLPFTIAGSRKIAYEDALKMIDDLL